MKGKIKMKKHHEIDFIDGKIVHSVNRCIVYNNKHIEIARFKQPDCMNLMKK